MNNRILIIGGACFEAEKLIKEKLDNGFEVVCIDNLSKSSIENIEKFNSHEGFVFVKHDMNTPFFVETSEVYNFISEINDNIKGNIKMLLEKNKIGDEQVGVACMRHVQDASEQVSKLKNDEIKTISIIGTGYVGLTFAAVLATVGYRVYTVDIDEEKINTIKTGKSYFFDPGLDDFIKKGLENGNLIPTTSYKEAIPTSDAVFICVGTPATEDGSTNLDYVFSAVNEIIENAEKDFILVQKSTVPVKTAREIERIISDKNDKNLKVNILSTPEFLREGSAIFDTLFFDRVVVGGDFDSAKKIVEIYRNVDNFSKNLNIEDFHDYAFLNINPKYIQNMPVFEDRVVITDIESAELIKVTANSFLALKIAFANTVARICDKTGADSRSVFDGVGMDNRIGRAFLYPGLGYGGDCFPKDVAGMIDTASSFDVNFGILHEVVNVNKTQTYFVIDKIKKLIGVNDLHGKVITILGLAFKAGTSDVRKSPSIRLIEKLLKQGAAIKAFDPRATENAKIVLKNKRVEYFYNIEDACDGAEIAVLATEWKELIDFDYSKIKERLINPIFLDGKGVLNLEKMRGQGFKIERI